MSIHLLSYLHFQYVWTVAAVFYSYFIGYIFYVCVEAPFVNQTKLLQRVILG